MKERDYDLLASALRFLKGGEVKVGTGHGRSLVVSVQDGVIDLNFLDPALFSTDAKRKGILDSLQEAKELGRALADNEIPISFSRKSKPVLMIGHSAKPSVSRIVTRSKEIQVLSIKELRALDRELEENRLGVRFLAGRLLFRRSPLPCRLFLWSFKCWRAFKCR